MKLLPSAWLPEKNKLASQNAWVWLYEITLPTTPAPSILRIAESQVAVIWNSNKYDPWPITHSSESESSDGKFNAMSVTVSNVNREIQAYLEEWKYLRGQKITVRLVNPGVSPLAMSSELYISETSYTEKIVTFNLALNFDVLGVVVGRRMYRDKCGWVYKSPECGSVSTLPSCDKTLGGVNGCRVHANSLRFGAAPGIPQGAVIIG